MHLSAREEGGLCLTQETQFKPAACISSVSPRGPGQPPAHARDRQPFKRAYIEEGFKEEELGLVLIVMVSKIPLKTKTKPIGIIKK